MPHPPDTWWSRHVSHRLVHAGCSARPFTRARRRMLPQARGVVVEVGVGTGLSLPHYDPRAVARVIGVDPDEAALARAARGAPRRLRLDLRPGRGEALPVEDECADTAVVAYALCTIPDPAAALAEVARVLRPGGALIFLEHGRASGAIGRRWQERLEGPWARVAGGCHLTREPLALIRAAGFDLREARREPFGPLLWPLGQQVSGVAVVPAGRRAGPG